MSGSTTASTSSTDSAASAAAEPPARRARWGRLIVATLAAAPLAVSVSAAAASIYSCTDASGKRLTSDRPIAECIAREQRVLNTDGSMREIMPPTPTAEERAEQEQRAREAETARAAKQDAIRRDRNLLIRFPDVATHNKAREAALDDVRKSVRVSQARVALLAAERKPLLDEAEFYIGKQMPGKLRAQLDANDASTDAQKNLIQNQQLEIIRINGLYDAELERLKRLWSGAQPGSMGKLPVAAGSPLSPMSTLAGPATAKPLQR